MTSLKRSVLVNALRKCILKRMYHSHFNPDCYTSIHLQTLKTRFLGHDDKMNINDLRIAGLNLQLSFYDSHRFDKSVKYSHSELKTVLLLPSSNEIITKYQFLIGEIVKKNCRVIALEFPGAGQSRLLENDFIYTGNMLQKTSIIQDFLNSCLPFRKKPLNGLIGFNDNSYVMPLINQKSTSAYPGHMAAVLIDPAPPVYITDLKNSVLNKLPQIGPVKQMRKKLAISKLKEHYKYVKDEQLYRFFESWSQVDPKSLDRMLMKAKSTELFIVLNKNEQTDQNFNSLLKTYFKQNEFVNFNEIAMSEGLDSELVKKISEIIN